MIATGGEQKQYEVVLDPARLAAHQVTLGEVEEGDRCEQERDRGLSGRAGAGVLARGVGRLGDIDAIAAVSVKTTDAAPCSSATSESFVKERQSSGVRFAQRQASRDRDQKQPGVNTLELTERIDATLEDVQRALPQGMQIHRDLFRQADFIEQSLNNLFTAFIEGAALVILVVVCS